MRVRVCVCKCVLLSRCVFCAALPQVDSAACKRNVRHRDLLVRFTARCSPSVLATSRYVLSVLLSAIGLCHVDVDVMELTRPPPFFRLQHGDGHVSAPFDDLSTEKVRAREVGERANGFCSTRFLVHRLSVCVCVRTRIHFCRAVENVTAMERHVTNAAVRQECQHVPTQQEPRRDNRSCVRPVSMQQGLCWRPVRSSSAAFHSHSLAAPPPLCPNAVDTDRGSPHGRKACARHPTCLRRGSAWHPTATSSRFHFCCSAFRHAALC